MDNFSKYQALRDAGATSSQVYAQGKSDQLDELTLIRMLRTLFGRWR